MCGDSLGLLFHPTYTGLSMSLLPLVTHQGAATDHGHQLAELSM